MKTIILVLCALFAFASAGSITKAAYTDVSESEWQTGDIGNSLNYGIQQILKIALKAKKIANTDYALSKINNVQQQPSGKSGVNHKFNIVLTNSEGTSTMTTTFVVYFVSFSGYRYLPSFSYNVLTTTTIPGPTPLGDYVKLCNTKVKNNQDLKEAFIWAMNTIYQTGVNAGKIPEDSYSVLDMTVWKQKMTNGNNYKVEVELHNGKTISLFEKFVLNYPTSGKKMLSSWSYKVTGIPVTGN